MFIELVDVLRCLKPHEESWLVLSASRMSGRQVLDGELGCHVCQQRYPIRNGVAHFGDAVRVGLLTNAPASADGAMRMAALLGLAESGGVVLLFGENAALAPTLEMLVADTQFLAVNGGAASESAGQVSHLETSFPLPLSSGSCRAAAVDAAHARPELLAEVARVLRSRGRMVVPANAPLPAGVKELARDEREIVAEQAEAPGVLVPLELSRRK